MVDVKGQFFFAQAKGLERGDAAQGRTAPLTSDRRSLQRCQMRKTPLKQRQQA